jgi:hypothetical protein
MANIPNANFPPIRRKQGESGNEKINKKEREREI